LLRQADRIRATVFVDIAEARSLTRVEPDCRARLKGPPLARVSDVLAIHNQIEHIIPIKVDDAAGIITTDRDRPVGNKQGSAARRPFVRAQVELR
jgi:hypothetical protein